MGERYKHLGKETQYMREEAKRAVSASRPDLISRRRDDCKSLFLGATGHSLLRRLGESGLQAVLCSFHLNQVV